MNKLIKRLSLKPQLLAFLSIAVIALILVVIWFHQGFILGTAEAEIPFYNLEGFQRKTEYTWINVGLGLTSNLTLASSPSWWLLSQIQNLGIPGFIIQATVFWLILISSGIGMYLLTQFFFPRMNKKYVCLGALFYWFNPLVLTSVWNRFLYNYMVFYALLPGLIYLYIRALERRKYIYAIFIPLFLTFFSYALTGYVFNLLLLLLLFFTWVFVVLINFNKNFLFFTLKFNFLASIAFLVISSWWIFPTLQFLVSKDTTQELSQFVNVHGNLVTLDVLSQKLGRLIDIVRLLHIAFYENEGPSWAINFITFPTDILLFVMAGFILWGIFASRKEKWGLYLGTLFLMGIFLAKGNAPPFGNIFQYFFLKISFLQVFRDPFEKFAFFIALAAAPLISIGFADIEQRLKGVFKVVPILLFIAIIAVLGLPFFTDLVFTGKNPPNDNYSIGYKVKVPDYYKDADIWLESQGDNFRFIGFPLRDEGITYKWEKGYQGVESGEILFSTPNILFNTTIPYYHQVVERLVNNLYRAEKFTKIADILNVKYFMVRSDIDYKLRGMRSPESVEERLTEIGKTGDIKKISQFGKLSFWENLKWRDKTIYPANYLVTASPNSLIDDILLDEVDDRSVVYNYTPNLDLQKFVTGIIIHPLGEQKYGLSSQTYTFDVPEEGQYELLLDKSKQFLLLQGLKLSIDGKEASASSKERKDDRILRGKFFLKQGKHELVFSTPLINRLTIPESITLNNGKGNFITKINDFDPYSRYYGSFDFLIKNGQGFNLGLVQGSNLADVKNLLFNQQVKNDAQFPNFRHAEGPFSVNGYPTEANFFFNVDTNVPSEVIFRSIILTKLDELLPVLIKNNPRNDSRTLPVLSYAKINPTQYKIKVTKSEQPFILVLSQLYHPGWEAKYQDEKIIEHHFRVNSFANAWLIDRKGDFNITLEFTHQKSFDLGKIISVLSLMIALIFVAGSILLTKKKI